METGKKYRFSFTAGSLLLEELKLVIDAIAGDGRDLNDLDPSVINKTRKTTSKREFGELKIRVAQLSEKELRFFYDASEEEQIQLAFIAAIRAYEFIQDFLLQVVKEKLETLDYYIVDRDYNKFIDSIEINHPEYSDLSDSTKSKIKQVMFKIFEQAGFIHSIKKRELNPYYLEDSVRNLLSLEGRLKDLSIFI
jgi:hypothetical protein